MAKYSDIKGFTVQTVSTDPAASGIAAGSWASGGTMNTARAYGAVNTLGTQTASIGIGGYIVTGVTAVVEQYDGSSWTEVGDLNQQRSSAFGNGPSAAAYVGGGFNPPNNLTNTETWNNSSWTEVNDMNTGRRHGGNFGDTTGIAASGFITPGNRNSYYVESWDGTNWTEVAEMNTARQTSAGLGVSYTSGLIATGGQPSTSPKTETWNGSAWTEVGDVNTARDRAAGGGTITDGLITGGEQPSGPVSNLTISRTLEWNILDRNS